MSEPLLRAERLSKAFFKGGRLDVLRGVDLEVDRGEFVSLVGSSGSGKTTLLQLVGLLARPDEGEIFYDGRRVDALRGRAADRYRNRTCGFIFQFFHLLPELTAVENVMLPRLIGEPWWKGLAPSSRSVRREATEMLERVGLADRAGHLPTELSGGEMQRIGIARALFGRPGLLLADEPTGNLDAETGESVIGLLDDLRREAGLTLVLVTHDLQLAGRADRRLHLIHGRIEAAPPLPAEPLFPMDLARERA